MTTNKAELENKIREIFEADKVVTRKTSDGQQIIIELSAMYQAPGRSLSQLLKLAEVLGTDEIEEYDSIAVPGCDTCDFGSRYGVELIAPFTADLR